VLPERSTTLLRRSCGAGSSQKNTTSHGNYLVAGIFLSFNASAQKVRRAVLLRGFFKQKATPFARLLPRNLVRRTLC